MLVKPQFELQPGQIGKGGIVRDPALYAFVEAVREACAGLGLSVARWFDTPISGGDGNREFFVHAVRAGGDSGAGGAAFRSALNFFRPRRLKAGQAGTVRQQFYARKPEFCSVTYGAGGSTQERHLSAVREILAEGVDAASHFSCIGATRDTVREQLRAEGEGVKRMVALRGDLPSGYGGVGEFQYASELVAFIRQETGATSISKSPATPRCIRRRARPRPI